MGAKQVGRIDVSTVQNSTDGWPVSAGIPCVKGALTDGAAIAVVDPSGATLPATWRRLADHDDGSARYAFVTFLARATGMHTVQLAGTTAAEPLRQPVTVKEEGTRVVLDNGLLRVVLGSTGAGPIHHIAAFDRTVLGDAADFQLRVDDASSAGELSRKMTVVANSPLRACVRISGAQLDAQRQPRLHYQLNIELWAGSSALRIDYWFFNLLKGVEEINVKCIEAVFRMQSKNPPIARFLQCDHGPFMQPLMVENPNPVGIITTPKQDQPFVEDEAMMLDDSPYPFYLRNDKLTASPWLGLVGDGGGMYLGMADMTNLRPKRLGATGNRLSLELWPQTAGMLTLPQGRSRRVSMTLAFSDDPQISASDISRMLESPRHEGRALASHEDLRAAGDFHVQDLLKPRTSVRFEKIISRSMGLNMPKDFMNYGDTSDAGYNGTYLDVGRRPVKPTVLAEPNRMQRRSVEGVEFAGDDRFEPVWTNNEYDVIHTYAQELARTGKQALWPTLIALARANIEVAFVWYSDDPWTHRATPAHSAFHNFASAYPSHIWTQGLLEYYCLSGDQDALLVAEELGDAVLKNLNDPVRGKLQKGFTREVGWPVLALAALYDVTRKEKYLAPLKELVDFLITYDIEGQKGPVHLSGVDPRHDIYCQFIGSFFGYASMVEGIHYYSELSDRQDVRDWLIWLLNKLENAIWELHEQGRPLGVGHMVPQAMAIGYELTGDEKFIRAGMSVVEEGLDTGLANGSRHEVKPLAMFHRGLVRILHHAQTTGMLDEFEYFYATRRKNAESK